jgi:probable phosphoglycerate mutase
MDYINNPWEPPIAFIVRHGETELNAANCFRGWENPCLNEEGQAAAALVANFFMYENIGRIVSSDLDRATQTAQAILGAGTSAVPYVSSDFNLRPWNIGGFAGKEKTDQNQKRLQRYIDNPELKIPDGASLKEFQDQQNESLMQYVANPYEGLPTVIVTHTSNLTYLAQRVDIDNGVDPSHDPEVHDIVEPGGIVAVYMDTSGKMKLQPRMGAIEAQLTPEAS